VEAGLAQGAVELAPLLARVRTEFPALRFERAALNDSGEDHAIVLLDDTWVVRFPRSAEAAAYSAQERRLLERLARVSNLAVPRYEHVAAAGDFGGYPMIAGAPLTPARFAALDRASQTRVLDEMGVFLRRLHDLPPTLCEAGPAAWSGADYATRFSERRPTFRQILAPALLGRAEAFYAALPAAVATDVRRPVHNDFTDDHVLLAPDGDRLAGVIDFTDAGLGDPACDFTFLWAYAEWAPAHAIEAYGDPGLGPGLLTRSRWWFVRYGLDQLWWNAMGHRAYDPAAVIALLERDLAALGF
jgi:aminoglycoside phosphotransferase (APT) family kinase protein